MADVPGGFFEITGKFEELVRIEEGIENNDGRLTASSSATLDLWLEMREKWISVHTLEVLRRARSTAEGLRCAKCLEDIEPDQYRFKVWKQDDNGNTIERGFVHLFHILDDGDY